MCNCICKKYMLDNQILSDDRPGHWYYCPLCNDISYISYLTPTLY